MLPITRVASEWRRVLVPLAVLAVINVAVYAFAVYPMSQRAAGAERRAQASRDALASARQEHARAQAVVNSTSQATAGLGRFYGDVLPADLAGARRMTYARLAQLARETNLLYDRRSFERDDGYGGALEKLNITMELEGDYRDIREFIYRLEASPEFVVIEDVALSSGADEEAPLTLTLRLATYFRGQDDGG
jgi:Tfp pilus assembly protein PilO